MLVSTIWWFAELTGASGGDDWEDVADDHDDEAMDDADVEAPATQSADTPPIIAAIIQAGLAPKILAKFMPLPQGVEQLFAGNSRSHDLLRLVG